MAQTAHKVGVKVEDWRVTFQPVPRAYWLRVDIWQDGVWCPVEIPGDDRGSTEDIEDDKETDIKEGVR